MTSKLIDLSPEDVKTQIDAGDAILIDVRDPGEYEDERVPGAFLMPLNLLNGSQFPVISGVRVILMCAAGGRSTAAAERLMESGFKTVHHLKGGIQAWKDAGFEVQVY